jgi:hypothetical protein
MTVLCQASNPTADFVAIEGRIEPHPAVPSAIEPILRFCDVFGCTVPWARSLRRRDQARTAPRLR